MSKDTSEDTSSAARLARVDDVIERVTGRIVETCDPDAVYLFGSAARGEAVAGSDVDLLVVVSPSGDESTRDIATRLYRQFRGSKIPLDIVVRTPEQFELGRTLPGFIERRADTDGRQVYPTGEQSPSADHTSSGERRFASTSVQADE